MTKFRVVVHGRNYRIGVATRRFLFWKSFNWERVGFYTTRFVEAATANEAIAKVYDLLNQELESDGRTTDEATLDLAEIREDEYGFGQFAPGTGYTFYTGEDDNEDEE